MTNEQLHDFRKQIDYCIVETEADIASSAKDMATPVLPYIREMALVRTKLQEAKMWVGKCLEVAGSPFPKELADKSE